LLYWREIAVTGENNNKDFIKETIKDTPVNKKKAIRKIIFAAAEGVVFGLAAAVALACAYPALNAKFNGGTEVAVEETSDKAEAQTDVEAGDENSEETEASDEGNTEIRDVNEEKDIDDSTENSEEAEQPSEGEKDSDVETEAGNETVEEELTPEEIANIRLKEYQELQNNIYDIGKAASGSLVNVVGTVSDTDWFDNDYESETIESGIILAIDDKKVQVLSVYDAIKSSENVFVTFCDGKSADAEVVSYDGNTGLCVLNISMDQIDKYTKARIRVATMVSLKSMRQGDVVIAVGNPLGTNQSIAIGNIVASDSEIQTVDQVYSVFSTDIVGNDGSSGVLLNLDGEVTGFILQGFSLGAGDIITAIAVPELKDIIAKLQAAEKINYAGVYIKTITESIHSEYDIPYGVYINQVIMDSPAMEAGIQAGDVITKVNDASVKTADEFSKAIRAIAMGETYTITVKRQSGEEYKELTFDLTARTLKK